MYEHLRNDFLSAAHDARIPTDALATVVRILDQVAARYEIQPRELSLAVYNDGLPEVAKVFLVCKKIEGLSEATLATYMRTLKLFFQDMTKPLERITANDVRFICSIISRPGTVPTGFWINTGAISPHSSDGQLMKATCSAIP